MAGFAQTLSTYAKTAKQNLFELFNGNTHEEIINAAGRKVIVINDFRLPENPLPGLRKQTTMEWLFFASGHLILFVDVLNFTSVTLQTSKLAEHFNCTKAQVTMAITMTLMTKFIGAVIFGIAADLMGRKYPMIINCILMAVFQFATTYTASLKTFQISRVCTGMVLGGIWSNAAATALEHSRHDTRGLLSGLFESAASSAFLVANIINLAVGRNPDNWRIMFWIGAAAALLVALLRLCLPESAQFTKSFEQYEEGEPRSVSRKVRASIFLRQMGFMIRHNWPTMLYMLGLITCVCGVAMNSADPYVIFLQADKGMSYSTASKVATIVSVGGILGSPIVGWFSQTIGRRRALVFSGIFIGALIPWTIIPKNHISLAFGGFLTTFFQGVLGVMPIHLNELSEPKFRTLVPGIIFQIGFALSAPLPQLVINLAEKTKVIKPNGQVVENYGPLMAGFMSICLVVMIILAAVGPERRGSRFEMVAPAGIDETKRKAEPMKTVLVFGNRSATHSSDY